MKSVRNKKLTIAAATSMAIFSLAAVFAACIAWFSTNTIVNNETDDPGINVSYATGNLNYIEFHRLSSTTRVEQVATYHFNKTAYCTLTYNWRSHTFSTTGNSNDCPMGQYTLLDQEHPLLMIIAFHKQVTSQVAGDINIKGYTDVQGFLGETEGNSPKYELGNINEEVFIKRTTVDEVTTDYYALSSVVKFDYKEYTSSAYNTFIASGATLDYSTNDTDIKHGDTFVSFDNNDQPSFNNHPTIYSSVVGHSVQYIALLVNYYPDALNSIFSTYMLDTTLDRTYDGFLNFACDWFLEIT